MTKKNKKPSVKQQLEDALTRERTLRDNLHSIVDHLFQHEVLKTQVTDYLRNESDFIDNIRFELEDDVRESVKEEIISELS